MQKEWLLKLILIIFKHISGLKFKKNSIIQMLQLLLFGQKFIPS